MIGSYVDYINAYSNNEMWGYIFNNPRPTPQPMKAKHRKRLKKRGKYYYRRKK